MKEPATSLLSALEVRISARSDEQVLAITRNWGRRIVERLRREFPETDVIRWFEEPVPAAPQPFAGFRQDFDVHRGGRARARVRLGWTRVAPGHLKLSAGAEGLPRMKSWMGKMFGYLAWSAAIASFVLWLWFVWSDWHRIWNRLANFSPGYDAAHATKLEVAWLLVGWIMGPVFAAFLVHSVGQWIEGLVHRHREHAANAFARSRLQPLLEQLVREVLAECSSSVEAAANLGQMHVGAPHPALPNLICDEAGKFRPASGYTWATDDPNSMAVKSAP